jgi:AcrR family transcriptional regulator
MERRAAAVEETRRRIVQATMELHFEKGMVETTLQDIAHRADVALGTVYRHFPTLDDVVTACGDAWLEQNPLPGSEDIPAAFRGARSTTERAERLAGELAKLYREWLPVFLEVRRARHVFGRVEEGHREMEATVDAFVEEALRPLRASKGARRAVRGLADARTWDALLDRGVNERDVEPLVARLVRCALDSG